MMCGRVSTYNNASGKRADKQLSKGMFADNPAVECFVQCHILLITSKKETTNRPSRTNHMC